MAPPYKLGFSRASPKLIKNRGGALWQLGRYPEADAALRQAFSIASQPEASYKEVLAWVHLTNSQIALSQRRFGEAKAKAQEALDAAGTEIKDLALQAKYTMALAQAFSGSPQQGRKLCEEALANAKEGNSPRLISSALLALSEVLLLGNDPQGALANALQAQAIFERSGEQDSEWRAWLVAARAVTVAYLGTDLAARGLHPGRYLATRGIGGARPGHPPVRPGHRRTGGRGSRSGSWHLA